MQCAKKKEERNVLQMVDNERLIAAQITDETNDEHTRMMTMSNRSIAKWIVIIVRISNAID